MMSTTVPFLACLPAETLRCEDRARVAALEASRVVVARVGEEASAAGDEGASGAGGEAGAAPPGASREQPPVVAGAVGARVHARYTLDEPSSLHELVLALPAEVHR